MDFFKNKHVVVALIVAPILAVLSYFAVDAIVSETPHAAEAGKQYELVSLPNCRYNSGVCGLKNGEFELTLKAEWQEEGRVILHLTSAHPLDGAMIAAVNNASEDKEPVEMYPEDRSGLNWSLELMNPNVEQGRLRLAVSSNKTLYYGDAAMKFALYETIFDEDFRQ
ncbi:MAG: hypothetical protein CL693_17145 [Cellvibrionaceae bacterium]|nr:hypothetical protein [Cellvibrionaceae bacterium]